MYYHLQQLSKPQPQLYVRSQSRNPVCFPLQPTLPSAVPPTQLEPPIPQLPATTPYTPFTPSVHSVTPQKLQNGLLLERPKMHSLPEPRQLYKGTGVQLDNLHMFQAQYGAM